MHTHTPEEERAVVPQDGPSCYICMLTDLRAQLARQTAELEKAQYASHCFGDCQFKARAEKAEAENAALREDNEKLVREMEARGRHITAQTEALKGLRTLVEEELFCECLWPNGGRVIPCRGTCSKAIILKALATPEPAPEPDPEYLTRYYARLNQSPEPAKSAEPCCFTGCEKCDPPASLDGRGSHTDNCAVDCHNPKCATPTPPDKKERP
jgi:hypothetical protein